MNLTEDLFTGVGRFLKEGCPSSSLEDTIRHHCRIQVTERSRKNGMTVKAKGANVCSEVRLKRILIVDDNRFARRMLRSLLFSAGFDVDTATDGDAARDILTEKRFDLVIIDIDVPVANIRELYQCVSVEHPDCKVVFMSANILDGDTQSFLREANRPFLPKPFTISQLMAVAGWVADAQRP